MNLVLDWLALAAAAAASTGLLLNRNWRWSLGALALLYLAEFWLVLAHWPVGLATVKLVAGWMACAVLGLAQLDRSRVPADEEAHWPQGNAFRLFAAGMVGVVAFGLAGRISYWLGLSTPFAWGSLLVLGMGFLQLGLTNRPFRVIVALLTLLGGFEVLYASVENSTLVAALLVVVNLGLALAGSYFQTVPEVAE